MGLGYFSINLELNVDAIKIQFNKKITE